MPSPTPLKPTDLTIDRADVSVAVVTINRPERRNAMTLAMWRELGRIIDALGHEPALRAIVLTGAGGAFCAGADISEFAAVRATPADGSIYETAVDTSLLALKNSPKATIAAVTGPCYGGGVGLAMTCDFRVADPSSSFAIPAARLSNVYGVLDSRAVLDAVGLAVAKEILFSGRRYGAEEAHKVGLATHFSATGALAGARELGASLKASAPLTIKGTKIVLAALAEGALAERAAAVKAVKDEAMASADYKEGVAAFREKRDPVFRGR